MNTENIVNMLAEVLDYLETDDYDEYCTYHIQMINYLKTCIKLLEI